MSFFLGAFYFRVISLSHSCPGCGILGIRKRRQAAAQPYAVRRKKDFMTEKLYYEDNHLSEFTAQVTRCEWEDKKQCYGVVLDRTAFFPEGGGQYADPGFLEGLAVADVREKGDEIVHYVKEPLEAGRQVKGVIDYGERFSRMQQHSGEHIVSGLVHSCYGYENVGFHLGEFLVTMDFNGMLTLEQLREIETAANGAVAANLEIQVTYPSKEELAALEYRSKKELSGQVRIVTVPGYDVCACCAPHVSRTGEIGMIRLVDAAKYKGGTRVSMVCGFRALRDCRAKEDSVREISHLLSAKPDQVAQAVARLCGEAQQYKEKLARMQSRYLEGRLEELLGAAGNAAQSAEGAASAPILIFEDELDKNAARRFVDAGMHRFDGICGAFIGNDADGWQYTLGSRTENLRELLKEFHGAFAGKGGGKPEMVQGTVAGSRAALEGFFAERTGRA